MAKVKFQGYASGKQYSPTTGYQTGKGFSNVDPGYSALSRLQEKQNQDLANLKEEQKEQRARDLQAEADLARVMKTEEANRKEIYIEDKVLTTRERALQNNLNIETQNFKAEMAQYDQKREDLQKIIGFSQQAFKDYQTLEKKNWDATAEASYNYYMTHGTSLEDQLGQDLIEDEIFDSTQTFESIADQMRNEGYSPSEINYVRHQGNAADYGRLKAYSVKAGQDWQPWANRQLIERGITNPNEQKAALDKLRIEYLKKHKLYGVSSDFLEPMFQRMRRGTESILSKSIHTDDVNFTKTRSAQTFEVLATFTVEDPKNAPDALNNYFLAKTRELKENGNYLTTTEAKQATIASLDLDFNPNDDVVIDLLKNTKLLHMNKSWFEANPEHVQTLLESRRIERDAREAEGQAQIKQKQEGLLSDTRKFFQDPTRWNGDLRVGKDILNELKLAQLTNDQIAEFQPYLDQSVQGRADGDQWRKIINKDAKDLTLTVTDLQSPWVPQDLKEKYINQARENDALFATVDFKDIRKDLGGYLRKELDELSLVSALHPSYNKALRHAEILFRKAFKANGGDEAAALQQIGLQIENQKGKFKVITPNEQKGNQSFFAAFTPGSHRGAPKILNTSDWGERDKVLNKLQDNPTLLDTELLVHPLKYKEIADNIKQGKSYRIPEEFYDISKADPEVFGSAIDVYQRQLKVAVNQGHLEEMDLTVVDFRKTLFRDVEDPEAKKLINNIRTKSEFLQTIQKIYKPDSARDPKYMSTLVQRKLQVPSVLERTLTREQLRDDDTYEYEVNLNPFATGQYYEYSIE